MSKLSDFRVDGEAPPVVEHVFRLTNNVGVPILAFDQTCSNTGIADMTGVRVNGTSMLAPEADPDLKPRSKAEMLSKADVIFERVRLLIAQRRPRLIAIEKPPEGNGSFRGAGSGESSLIAACAIRNAASSLHVPLVMVQSQHMKKLITGNAKASKAEVGEAVRRAIPHTWVGPKNEHTHDAIAIGLVALEEWSPR